MTDEKKAAPKRPSKDEDPVEELREERAEIIEQANKDELERQKQELEAGEESLGDQHVAKLDDDGAREQQRASEEPDDASEILEEKGLTGPPVVAPVFEENPGSLKLTRREDFNLGDNRNAEGRLEMPKAKAQKRSVRMGELSGLWLQGKDFPAPGEVIFDIRQEDGQNHQRYSAWTEDGTFDVQLPGVLGPGTWLLHAESLITQVGEGRPDHLPLIKVGEEIKIEVSA